MNAAAVYQRIDALLHDAEQAQGGAVFARWMVAAQPGNPQHAQVAKRLDAKRDRLVRQARALDPDRTAPAWRQTTLAVEPEQRTNDERE